MRFHKCGAIGVFFLLGLSFGRGEDVPPKKVAATPEEALRYLCEFAKEGNVEGHLRMFAEPTRTILQYALDSEKEVAILEKTIKDKNLPVLLEEFGEVGAVWFQPWKQESQATFVYSRGISKGGIKEFPQFHQAPVLNKEVRKDGSVVLTVKHEFGNQRFTAKKDQSGWRLVMWIPEESQTEQPPEKVVYFEPTVKSAALCKTLQDRTAAIMLEVAEQVREGKIKDRRLAWLAVGDKAPRTEAQAASQFEPEILRKGEKGADGTSPILVYAEREKTIPLKDVKSIREVRNEKNERILWMEQADDPDTGKYYDLKRRTTKTATVLDVGIEWKPRRDSEKPPPDTTLSLLGRAPGTARLTIIGWDGAKTSREVVVRRQVLVFVGQSETIQLHSKKRIKTVYTDGERFMQLSTAQNDNTKVQIKGLAAADSRCTLTAFDGEVETIEVAIRSTTEVGKNTMMLSLWQQMYWQSPDKKFLTRVAIDRAGLVDIPHGDPRVMILKTLRPGLAKLTITEEGGETYEFELIIRPEKFRWQDVKGAISVAVGEKKVLGPTFQGRYELSDHRLFGDGTLTIEEIQGDPTRRSFRADQPGVWAISFIPDSRKDDKDKAKVTERDHVLFVVVDQHGGAKNSETAK
ncbi:hypothetical protein AYO44_05125 [Planctomycetaceae bacterium SCGC AG-212-F19]|nr:hypothetical protein AYO44_05125 [Planctomycetaceae bacterium SCGC AG-212-F19]